VNDSPNYGGFVTFHASKGDHDDGSVQPRKTVTNVSKHDQIL
jgi:hypothetical protein